MNVLLVTLVFASTLRRRLTYQPPASTTDALVARFYPSSIKLRNGAPVPIGELQEAHVSVDLDHSGQQFIVALYANDDDAVLEVLSAQSEGSLLAADTETKLPGGNPSLRLLDVDGDGRLDIIATIGMRRGGDAVWIYRWSGSQLLRVHRAGGRDGWDDMFADPTFLDLDGDGVLEIVEHTVSKDVDDDGAERWTAAYRVFALSQGAYHETAPADRLAIFSRGKGALKTVKNVFHVDDATASRRVVLVNGSGDAAPRVASAVVKLNGRTVFSEKDFDEHADRLEAPATVVAGDNQLTVELRGAPGSCVTIIVMPR